MNKEIGLPELSAAVTSIEILSGINLENLDAVYLGQPYCLKVQGNLLVNLDELSEAVNQVKKSGKRAYLTTPIVPKGSDFAKVEKAVGAAVEAGVDGVEIYDVGVFRLVKSNFPELPIHMSSLANIYQPETAAFYRDRGAARIVPANELLASEIKIIKDAVNGIEFSIPVHGNLPLGMSYACLLRTKFPSREIIACRQQCAGEHYLDMGDWRMRCVGTSLITGDDYSLIEHLPATLADGFAGWRLETHFDDASKINKLASIYRRAMSAASGKDYPGGEFFAEVKGVSGELCNGWHFGLSGQGYLSAYDADPLAAALMKMKVDKTNV